MIFRQPALEAIRAGTVTLAFRRWTRPTVKAGGTLLTAVGQLHIGAIRTVTLSQIPDADARRAGYASREALIDDLNRRDDGDIYRIELGALTADPRIALRETAAVTPDELRVVREKLRRMDARADEPWTTRVLTLIRQHPGRRAGDLCLQMGREKLALQDRRPQAQGPRAHREPRGRLPPVAAGRRPARHPRGRRTIVRR